MVGLHYETEKPKKIAIVGFAPSSRDLAPYQDSDWEIWGLNELYLDYQLPRWDCWFQLHCMEDIPGSPVAGNKAIGEVAFRQSDHFGWLKEQTKPVYLKEKHSDIPASVSFPFKNVFDRFGTYFTNTVSYMIALAIIKGAKEIALYGVDMEQGSEYGIQRPSCEYMIGVARGLGIKVHIPMQSSLMKAAWIYGYEDYPPLIGKLLTRKAELAKRANDLAEATAKLRQQIEHNDRSELLLRGAIDDVTYMIQNWGV